MRKIKAKIRIGSGPLFKECTVSAYMTSVAGLIVHPEVEYDTRDDRFINKRGKWSITQYPTGLQAFCNILSLEAAIEIVEKDMAPFNWVGLNAEDVMVVNDAKDMQLLANSVKEKIAKARRK
jgi:ArsR family metal-binding transcriptional regulator